MHALFKKRSDKSQSAMEYLMTYGWAILIIAVVLGVLFQLGVFSGIGVPKAQPGNCQVVKVSSGSIQTISLAGECQGQEPEYVATVSQGAASYITGNAVPSATSQLTLVVWAYGSPLVNGWMNALEADGRQYSQLTFDIGFAGSTSGGGEQISWRDHAGDYSYQIGGAGTINPNQWNLLVGIWNGSNNTLTVFVNGKWAASTAGNALTTSTTYAGFDIGGATTGVGGWNGWLANAQIYNKTLSGAEILALYQEGIGGAPIRPQNLLGWWPLNGNENDYSGYYNNGQPYGVGFSSFWAGSYTPP
jgi:hypothetical protein